MWYARVELWSKIRVCLSSVQYWNVLGMLFGHLNGVIECWLMPQDGNTNKLTSANEVVVSFFLFSKTKSSTWFAIQMPIYELDTSDFFMMHKLCLNFCQTINAVENKKHSINKQYIKEAELKRIETHWNARHGIRIHTIVQSICQRVFIRNVRSRMFQRLTSIDVFQPKYETIRDDTVYIEITRRNTLQPVQSAGESETEKVWWHTKMKWPNIHKRKILQKKHETRIDYYDFFSNRVHFQKEFIVVDTHTYILYVHVCVCLPVCLLSLSLSLYASYSYKNAYIITSQNSLHTHKRARTHSEKYWNLYVFVVCVCVYV